MKKINKSVVWQKIEKFLARLVDWINAILYLTPEEQMKRARKATQENNPDHNKKEETLEQIIFCRPGY